MRVIGFEFRFFLRAHCVHEENAVGKGGFGMAAVRAGDKPVRGCGANAEFIDLERAAACGIDTTLESHGLANVLEGSREACAGRIVLRVAGM
jgi:hypothetical protein